MPTANGFSDMDTPTPPSRANAPFAVAVHRLQRRSADVVMLQLRLPEGSAFTYQAGQFIAIHLPGGASRCYSMARHQEAGEALEFHIRLQPDGVFSQWLLDALNETTSAGNVLSISGPYGDCTWRTPPPVGGFTVMLGSGTGIAPLAALVEEALAKDVFGKIVLYWGGRAADDFYCAAQFEALERCYDNFRFVPVVDGAEPGWHGRRGFVQDCAAADFPDLSQANVYACGSPMMVRSARQTLLAQCRLDPERFYADAFEASLAALAPPAAAPPCAGQLRLADGREQALALTVGVSLMSALQAHGLMQGICGGQKSCGSCRVEIEAPWAALIPPADRAEQRLLAVLSEPRPSDRLACQIVVTPALAGLYAAIPDRPL